MPSAKQTLNTKNTPVAPSRLSRLPIWLSRWLGYRDSIESELPNYLIWFWSFIGVFCDLSVIQAVFGQAQYFIKRGAPQIIPSYGASALLVFGAIEAPFAQPRALMAGHFIGAFVGVCITKLFLLLLPTEERFEQLSWLAVSLSCATAIVAMQITATSHPPAAATALLPAVDGGIRVMGWYYLPVILLTSTLSLVVALIIDNIQRRYPVYWFKSAKPYPASPVKVDETMMSVQSSAITLPVGVHVAVGSVGEYRV